MIRRWHDRERARLRRALNQPSAARWENLGLWSRPDQPYTDAARALAERVARAADLQPGDAVLDIGPGLGAEQRTLWTDTHSIGRYCGWERDTATPAAATWQHVIAVDSAYFVPDLWSRWQSLWPQLALGGTITWTDLYLKRGAESWKSSARLRLTSAVTGIPPTHWQTRDAWLARLHTLAHGSVQFADLTDDVLGGFVQHMRWRKATSQARSGLRLAFATANLLAPLLKAHTIGYGLFQVRRVQPAGP